MVHIAAAAIGAVVSLLAATSIGFYTKVKVSTSGSSITPYMDPILNDVWVLKGQYDSTYFMLDDQIKNAIEDVVSSTKEIVPASFNRISETKLVQTAELNVIKKLELISQISNN